MSTPADYFSWRALRHCFYAVSPSESSYADYHNVPSYTTLITPLFLLLYVAEAALVRCGVAREEGTGFKDSVANFVCMMFCRFFHRLVKMSGVSLLVYVYVYDNYRLVDIAWDSYYVWFACMLAWDFTWYWLHRAAHEVSILWSFHQIHHSSEYFNLGVAMRAGVFVDNPLVLTFQLWQALFVPPSVYLVHRQLNVIAQIWTHCAVIPKVPLFDYVLNTPSLHRVHHGRNAYCIDKNYGGIFSFWDRMFGTLQEEKEDEKVHYGLIEQVKYYDCVKLQFDLVKYYSIDKPLSTKGGVVAKLKSIVYPPAWTADTPDSDLCQSAAWKRIREPEKGVPPVAGTRSRRRHAHSAELRALVDGRSESTCDLGEKDGEEEEDECSAKMRRRLALCDYALNAYALGHLLVFAATCYYGRPEAFIKTEHRWMFYAYGLATLYAVTAALDQRLRLLCCVELLRNACAIAPLALSGPTAGLYGVFARGSLGAACAVCHALLSAGSLAACVALALVMARRHVGLWRASSRHFLNRYTQ